MEYLAVTLFILGVLSWLLKTVAKLNKQVNELERRLDEDS